jgi:hypothetical protein
MQFARQLLASQLGHALGKIAKRKVPLQGEFELVG